ncbi:hypothetical protein [Pseudomonas entomophila]|uniref:hypothetical protein n=1 Tax=Pseudomonas entomophila TaxID=312306 RepID=UPI00200EC627|nr:hypothetical protein [Pseudomonas entomophila]
MRLFHRLIPALAIAWVNSCLSCALHDSRSDFTYHLNLPDDQCRTISYISGLIIPIQLSYPQGQAVGSGWKGEIIDVRLYYVTERYDFNALIDSTRYHRSDRDYDVYNIANEDNYIFNGSDQSRVIVRKRGYTWLAHRMQNGVLIMYQYDERFSNFKEIDEFVRVFVERILIHKD